MNTKNEKKYLSFTNGQLYEYNTVIEAHSNSNSGHGYDAELFDNEVLKFKQTISELSKNTKF